MAILTVGALFAFGDDNPAFRRLFHDVISEFVLDQSVTQVLGGGARIIDGDTIEVDGKRVRLHSIDAPESGQTCRQGSGCGPAASKQLGHLSD